MSFSPSNSLGDSALRIGTSRQPKHLLGSLRTHLERLLQICLFALRQLSISLGGKCNLALADPSVTESSAHSWFIFPLKGIMGKSLPWKRDKDQFKAWREGRTGVPFVDANMREMLVRVNDPTCYSPGGIVDILWHTLLNIVNIFFLLWYLMSFWLFFANCNMKKYVYCCNYQFPCTFPLPPPPPLTSPPPHSLRTANCTRNHCRRRSQFTVGNVNILWHTLLNIVNIFFLLWYLMSFWLFFANCNITKYVYCCNYQFPCTFLKSVTANFSPVNCELGL